MVTCAAVRLPGAVGATLSSVKTITVELPLSNGSLGIVIGDVSGHGLGPALIMAETRAYLRFLAELMEVPIAIVSLGAQRDQTIVVEDPIHGPKRALLSV